MFETNRARIFLNYPFPGERFHGITLTLFCLNWKYITQTFILIIFIDNFEAPTSLFYLRLGGTYFKVNINGF